MPVVAPMPVTVYAKYEFSEDEKKQLGQELAGKIDRAEGLKTEKKSLVSEINERIDGALNDIKKISSNINLGFETRSYTCKVEKNFKLKIKEYYCIHSGKLIETKKFEPHDFQQTFDDVKQDDKKEISKSGKDINPSIGQGLDILATKEEKKKAVGKAFDKEATKILNKAGIKKNGQPSKAKK